MSLSRRFYDGEEMSFPLNLGFCVQVTYHPMTNILRILVLDRHIDGRDFSENFVTASYAKIDNRRKKAIVEIHKSDKKYIRDMMVFISKAVLVRLGINNISIKFVD